MRILTGAGRFRAPGHGAATHFSEHLRATDLSVGTYSIPAGAPDDQGPHTEDLALLVVFAPAYRSRC